MATNDGGLLQAFDLGSIFAPARAIEDYMDQFLDTRPLPENLRAAIRYSLFGGGKRLRPILVVRACEAVGGPAEDAYPAASAVEMIHCFSLVHDDLPAMDDDDLRRGRPTLHKQTNEVMAILAGDAMMALAFELITSRIGDPQLSSHIARELSIAANDMISGQVYDTLPQLSAEEDPLERLGMIHRHKTAALIRAACRMGAICGGCSVSQLDALTQYAEFVGLMFQVVDDLLDVTATTEQLGKTAGKDAAQAKLTYPSLLGIEQSREEVDRLYREAIAALQPLGPRAQPLHDLSDYMAVRDR